MKKYQKYLIALGIALFVYTIVGFFVFPAAVKYFAVKTLQEEVTPEASIEKVRANPFTLQLQIENFNLPDPAGIWAVRYERATINVSAMTFLKFYPVMDFIRLEAPEIDYLRKVPTEDEAEVVIDAPEAESAAPQTLEELAELLNAISIPKVRIHLLEVVNGNLNFRDETNPVQFTESINPMNFVLEDFTTVVDASGDNTMRFLAKTDAGTELEWSGYLLSHPLSTEGNVRISGVRIDKFSPYFAQFLKFNLERAVYGMQFDYSINFGDLDALLQLSNGSVDLTDVICRPVDQEEEFFSLKSVGIRGFSAGYPSMKVEVDSIAVKEGFTQAVRDTNGAINLLDLVHMPEAADAEGPVEAEDAVSMALPVPTVRIHSITVEDYHMRWLDQFIDEPATLDVTLNTLSLSNVSSELTDPVHLELDVQLGESGQVSLAGDAVAADGKADFSIQVDGLPLDLVNAYGRHYAQAYFESGAFSFEGALQGDLANGYTLTGAGALPELKAHLDGPNKLDASWKHFEFSDLAVTSMPLGLKMGAIRIVEPSAQLTRAFVPDLVEDAVDEVDAPAEKEQDVTEPLEVDVQIGSFTVESGSVYIVDQVIQPSFRMAVENIQTEVTDITLAESAPTQFSVSAEVNRSPFKMEGSLFPVNPKANTRMQMELSGLALPVFSPYSGQAIGRKVGTGWFTLKTSATVDAGELDASNQIIIDEMALGDRVDSPDALRLPVGLAISLLKGPDGVMDLSLPLSGDLYDPSVGLGQIIRTAIVGLITNVASAPFKLLSGLVGADEDISKVSFAAGSAEISPETAKVLDTLSAALNKRPELNVVTVPSVSEDDLILLASRQLRAELLAETEDKDDKTFEKYLKRAYKEFEKANEPLPYVIPEEQTDEEEIAFMKAVLLTEVLPTDELAQALLQARIAAVQDHLVTINAIAAERVIGGTPDLSNDRSLVSFELE